VGVKIARGRAPAAGLMTGVGALAFAANASMLVFLWRHRGDDINTRSAWLCSRNEVIANGSVLVDCSPSVMVRSKGQRAGGDNESVEGDLDRPCL